MSKQSDYEAASLKYPMPNASGGGFRSEEDREDYLVRKEEEVAMQREAFMQGARWRSFRAAEKAFAVVDLCDNGHHFAKLDDHPTRDGKPRCPHCLVLGHDMLVTGGLGMKNALERIANHFDMDGLGPDAWENLALEMAEVAREALAKATQP